MWGGGSALPQTIDRTVTLSGIRGPGVLPTENFEMLCAQSCNFVHTYTVGLLLAKNESDGVTPAGALNTGGV